MGKAFNIFFNLFKLTLIKRNLYNQFNCLTGTKWSNMHDDLSLHFPFLSAAEEVQEIYFTGDFLQFIIRCEQRQNGFLFYACQQYGLLTTWQHLFSVRLTPTGWYCSANVTAEIHCSLVHLEIWILPLKKIHMNILIFSLSSMLHSSARNTEFWNSPFDL